MVQQAGLTFHSSMCSLLSDLRANITPPSDAEVLKFLYEQAAVENVAQMRENSDCRPRCAGPVQLVQLEMYTTDKDDVVELRLHVVDRWDGSGIATSQEFRYSGKCLYGLGDGHLSEPRTESVTLVETLPDGSERAVKGSAVYVAVTGRLLGAAPVRARPARVEAATGAFKD